jgi:site-specific DNA recombinase
MIEREDATLALIDPALWARVQAQLQRNRSRPKGNQTRENLLRGLITCGLCGCKYVGAPKYSQSMRGTQGYYYRWGGALGALHPDNPSRCRAKLINAEWLETLVWEKISKFIRNPGSALAELHQQL